MSNCGVKRKRREEVPDNVEAFMISGIDPRGDFAFKKVFGSESSKELTISLVNAVLQPPPDRRIVGLE